MITAHQQDGGIARLVASQSETHGRTAVPIAVWLVTRGVIASLDTAYDLACRHMPRPDFSQILWRESE